MDIREVLSKPEYDFLHTNPHLGKYMLFVTLSGSYAYGTNIEGSDIDIRGCTLRSPRELLGLSSFEQVVDVNTDTVIYSLKKLVSLLSECNPSTIEMLGCRECDYVYFSPLGQELITNKDLFLSKKAAASFGGYANQQLRRLQAALARDRLTQSEKESHILSSCKSSMLSFNERYRDFESGSFRLYIDSSESEDLETEIFADVNLSHYPLRDYKNIWSDLHNIVKDYGKINKRNNKKDDFHLNKHAMHLVRLYLMCIDILESQKIITYRKDDLPLLMSIRRGEFMKEDGTYKAEFFELIDSLEKRMAYASDNTALPETPDYGKIENLVVEMNREAVKL